MLGYRRGTDGSEQAFFECMHTYERDFTIC